MQTVNFLAVLVIAVIYMVLGFVWYGPLFGKMYGRIMGMDMASMTPEKKKEMQKRMGPVYFLNFIMVAITTYVLAMFLNSGVGGGGIHTAVWIWFGFIMPTVAGQAMWSGRPRNFAWQMFWLSMSYQLIGIIIAGAILTAWK